MPNFNILVNDGLYNSIFKRDINRGPEKILFKMIHQLNQDGRLRIQLYFLFLLNLRYKKV